ncbi:hypothetical protein R1sor_009113 [Riccia sorocarpa]|uniref:RING-type domain-containing protein n=1 Tax=Riccia sorocarpa TaxID=122646 RepID=A0ABD3HAV6_9MARC
MEGTEGFVGPNVPSLMMTKMEPHGDSWALEDCKDVRASCGEVTKVEVDKDFLCPICIQTMKDVFSTACGHSFCYMCIMTHLNNRNNCPCCGLYLTNNQLFPNFLLNKLLRKASACQFVTNASPTEHIRQALKQNEVSVKELDSLLLLLAEKKHKAEQEEAEANMEVLLEFLHRSRQVKQDELNELQADLSFLKEDIAYVERQRMELAKSKERYSMKIRMLTSGQSPKPDRLACGSSTMSGAVSLFRNGQGGASVPTDGPRRRVESNQRFVLSMKQEASGDSLDCDFSNSVGTGAAQTSVVLAKKRRVSQQFEDLQECYLHKRRNERRKSGFQRQKTAKDGTSKIDDLCMDRSGLEDFKSVLTAFTRYSKLRVIAELRHGDLFHSSNIVSSSIEFDRDDEFFATAGVSRRIKVFEFATVVNELADVHCPVVEMTTRSKLSCLSWNKYIKPHIASSDYEGIVTVWDVNTCQSIMEYEEHEKRAWSVDFSKKEPTRLVSGSDDGKVKVWCTRQETSVLNIDIKANICCVKYNPGSSNYVAVGSADSNIHYFDLRNAQSPLHVFHGHRKAVSYVKFVSPNELASASTDSTLRLWDVEENSVIRTLKGHANEKNFVGLTVNSEYIACGSETNDVYVYHKAMSKPAAFHRFGSPDQEDSDDDASHFISAVCWKSDSPTMLAANSQGTIKVLVLAP